MKRFLLFVPVKCSFFVAYFREMVICLALSDVVRIQTSAFLIDILFRSKKLKSTSTRVVLWFISEFYPRRRHP